MKIFKEIFIDIGTADELRCEKSNFDMLIGGGNQVNDQYGPATGIARAFRNGITLDGRPKNKGVRAYFLKL